MDNRIKELDFPLTLGTGSWSDRARITLALVFKSNKVRKLEEINPLAAGLVGIRGKELELSSSF